MNGPDLPNPLFGELDPLLLFRRPNAFFYFYEGEVIIGEGSLNPFYLAPLRWLINTVVSDCFGLFKVGKLMLVVASCGDGDICWTCNMACYMLLL